MKSFKRIMINGASIIAFFAKTSAKVSTNTTCMCVYHQPKVPASLNKLQNK